VLNGLMSHDGAVDFSCSVVALPIIRITHYGASEAGFMVSAIYKPPRGDSQGKLLGATDLLVQSTHGNIDQAHLQVQRSLKIVAHARELMARARLTVDRSRQIQNDLNPRSAGNPAIASKPGDSKG